jgi:hypothetical protein
MAFLARKFVSLRLFASLAKRLLPATEASAAASSGEHWRGLANAGSSLVEQRSHPAHHATRSQHRRCWMCVSIPNRAAAVVFLSQQVISVSESGIGRSKKTSILASSILLVANSLKKQNH